MKTTFFSMFAVLFLVITVVPCQSDNIGFIAPRNVFLGGEDPANFPDDKLFVLDTMDIEQPGLGWLVRHLEEGLGHTVNIYDAGSDDPAVVQADNDMVLISEAISSGQAGADYANSPIPVLSFEVYILDDMGFSSDNVDFTGRAHASEVHITNMDHPITRGLPETFVISENDELTGEPAILTFGSWAANGLSAGEILADLPATEVGGDPVTSRTDAPFLLVLEVGSSLGNDARWAFLAFSDETPEEPLGGNPELRTLTSLNENGAKLLDQTIEWVLGNEPTDVLAWEIF